MKKFIKKLLMATAAIALAFGFGIAPINASAEETAETPEISAETGEISNDGTAGEKTPVEGETGVETTFDNFLAWAQTEADRYGYGEDFAGAVEAVKTAATQKQVTISTIASVGLALTVIGFIIFHKIKDKKYKAALIELAGKLDGKLDDSIKGTNALIDGENALIDGETANGKTAADTKAEVQSIKRCLSAFVFAFLRFTDGVKLGENKKTEVQANCLNALKEIDGEVKADENYKE